MLCQAINSIKKPLSLSKDWGWKAYQEKELLFLTGDGRKFLFRRADHEDLNLGSVQDNPVVAAFRHPDFHARGIDVMAGAIAEFPQSWLEQGRVEFIAAKVCLRRAERQAGSTHCGYGKGVVPQVVVDLGVAQRSRAQVEMGGVDPHGNGMGAVAGEINFRKIVFRDLAGFVATDAFTRATTSRGIRAHDTNQVVPERDLGNVIHHAVAVVVHLVADLERCRIDGRIEVIAVRAKRHGLEAVEVSIIAPRNQGVDAVVVDVTRVLGARIVVIALFPAKLGITLELIG